MKMALKGVFIIAQTTLLEALRNRILLVSLAFSVLLLLVSIAGASSSIGEQDRIIIDIGLASASGLGSIIAIILLITSFASELKNKTAYTLLARPIPRWSFVLGKYFGVYAAMLIVVILMFVATAICLNLYDIKGIPLSFWSALWLCCVEMSVVISIAVLFSSMAVPVLAGIYSVGLILGGNFAGDVLALSERLAQKGNTSAVFFKGFYWLLPDIERLSLRSQVTNYLDVHANYIFLGTMYGFVYSAFLLSFAIYIFNQRRAI